MIWNGSGMYNGLTHLNTSQLKEGSFYFHDPGLPSPF